MTTRRHIPNNDNPFSGKAELKPLTQDDVSFDMIDSTPTTAAVATTAASGNIITTTSGRTDFEPNEPSPQGTTLEKSSSSHHLLTKSNPTPFSISDRFHSTIHRIDHWRNHDYAVGLVEPTWKEEIKKRRGTPTRSNNNTTDRDEEGSFMQEDMEANGPHREFCSDAGNSEMDPTCGCLLISGHVCGRMGFGRIGNMVILKERVVYETNGKGEKVPKRVLDCIVGPYWPMLVFVTYPLILGVSYWTAKRAIFVPNVHPWMVCTWMVLTTGLCLALFWVSCSDPGILPKYHVVPTATNGGEVGAAATAAAAAESSLNWRWNDRVQSYVPRGAFYDTDCAVVVEQFDHTCPWTGTAIGKKNMPAFQAFIFFLFSCLIMDVILLTSSAGSR